jgi:hypothetical protein
MTAAQDCSLERAVTHDSRYLTLLTQDSHFTTTGTNTW